MTEETKATSGEPEEMKNLSEYNQTTASKKTTSTKNKTPAKKTKPNKAGKETAKKNDKLTVYR